LPQELVQRLREGLRVEEPQWLALETEMRRFRSPLLDGLRMAGTRWHRATFTVEDLPEVHLIACEPFLSAVPTRILSDLVPAVEEGQLINDGSSFNVRARSMAAMFDLSKMRGRPVLIGEASNGPFSSADLIWARSWKLSSGLGWATGWAQAPGDKSAGEQ